MFDQSPYECRVEWGQRGAKEAEDQDDIIIIVDVLSFSSTVTTALNCGAIIFPYPPPMNETAELYAKKVGAKLVWGRAVAAKFGGHSLSPLTFTTADYNQKFVMCSLNGAACTSVASQVPTLLIGCLLNASAVADAANHIKMKTGSNISVIPCGERWSSPKDNENNMRPGIEDYLGAGFILSKLIGSKSPEAQVCIGAYESSKVKIQELVWDSGSGRELRERGYEQDVKYCAQIDITQAVPLLHENRFIKWKQL